MRQVRIFWRGAHPARLGFSAARLVNLLDADRINHRAIARPSLEYETGLLRVPPNIDASSSHVLRQVHIRRKMILVASADANCVGRRIPFLV